MKAHQTKRLKALQAQANGAALKVGAALRTLEAAEKDYMAAHYEALAYARECEQAAEERQRSDENDALIASAWVQP